MATYGIKFGWDNSNAYQFSNSTQGVYLNGEVGLYTIWDIAAPDIMISELWYDSVIEKLYKQVEIDYKIENGSATSACSEKFPDLYFDIEKYWLQIPAKDYVIDTSDAQDNSLCKLKLR